MSVDLFVAGRPGAPEAINVANGNWARLVEVIGIELGEDPWYGEIANLAQLRERVQICLEGVRAMPALGEIPNEAYGVPDGPLVIVCGWEPGYLEMRLQQLLKLIDFAIREGKPLRYT
jgi:hypothetical protein